MTRAGGVEEIEQLSVFWRRAFSDRLENGSVLQAGGGGGGGEGEMGRG